MAKTAFAVEDGLVPGHTASNIGHSANKFGDAHMSGDLNIDGDVVASGTVFSGGEEVSGGGGGGGIDAATSIAYAIALG